MHLFCFQSYKEGYKQITGNKKKHAKSGCTVSDMMELVEFLHEKSMYTEQGMTGADIHVPAQEEKQIQRELLGYEDPRIEDVSEMDLK